MKVAIHGRSTASENIPGIIPILDFLEDQGVELSIYTTFYQFMKDKVRHIRSYSTYCYDMDIPDNTEFMLSIGGDGTLLDAARFVRKRGIPLVGINLGRLGFLAYISCNDAKSSLSRIIAKNYTLEERSMLKISGNFLETNHTPYALNEVAVQRKEPSLIELSIAIDDEPLASYWSDGIIIATPTGSTAYSMSIGGPIVSPSAANLILAPLAPHNLAIRPIVIPDSSVVTCKLNTRGERAMVTVDNQMFDINDGASLIVEKSSYTIKLIKLKETNFYRTLRNKLHWGFDPRN
ncbi:MAG: NAD kinase [Prevotellaceae bacterium]|jgi:NAD+ kinase|nr:NAD kinase [Prevotellaceae bacterium]